MANTLHKVERLDKKKIIEKMFAGGSRSFSVFPLRVVYLPVEELEADEAQPRKASDTRGLPCKQT